MIVAQMSSGQSDWKQQDRITNPEMILEGLFEEVKLL